MFWFCGWVYLLFFVWFCFHSSTFIWSYKSHLWQFLCSSVHDFDNSSNTRRTVHSPGKQQGSDEDWITTHLLLNIRGKVNSLILTCGVSCISLPLNLCQLHLPVWEHKWNSIAEVLCFKYKVLGIPTQRSSGDQQNTSFASSWGHVAGPANHSPASVCFCSFSR